MHSVDPSPERFQSFLSAPEAEPPLVMLNLLRYRERANYPADIAAEPCSGREAYERYAATAVVQVGAVGGRVLWAGEVLSSVIAPEGEEWDFAVLVEYPSRAAFLKMLSEPVYQAAVPHRTAALADSRLIATHPVQPG